MTLEIKRPTDGTLPATKTTLYEVPSESAVSVRVKLANTSASMMVVNVYIKRKVGSSRYIFPKDLELPAGAISTSNYEEMEAGDAIEGSAGAAALVEYVVSGVRKR